MIDINHMVTHSMWDQHSQSFFFFFSPEVVILTLSLRGSFWSASPCWMPDLFLLGGLFFYLSPLTPLEFPSFAITFLPNNSNNSSILVPSFALVSINKLALCFLAISSPSSLVTYLSFTKSDLLPTIANSIFPSLLSVISLIQTSTFWKDCLLVIEYTYIS